GPSTEPRLHRSGPERRTRRARVVQRDRPPRTGLTRPPQASRRLRRVTQPAWPKAAPSNTNSRPLDARPPTCDARWFRIARGATMTTEEFSFEHEGTFEKGELTGGLKLGKFEVHYEEIFAEVIEDGVITLEERARLDKAADALGLDRQRLRKLEEALQAAYEARHHVRVREMADEEDAPPPASIVVRPEAAQ